MARIFLCLCIHYLLTITITIVPVESEKPPIPVELQRLFNTPDLENWVAPNELVKEFPYYLSGFDEDNHTIWVLELGRWDIRGAVEKGPESIAAFDKYVDQVVLIIYNSTLSEDGINQAIGVIDCEGYNLSQLTSPKTLAYIIQKLKFIFIALSNVQSAFVINANFFAEKIIQMVRPVLGKEFDKFEIFGTNPAKWKPQLLKVIPRDQLASWYGGSEDFKPIKVYG